MLDWNDPNVIKRFDAARNAYKRYKKLADKSDYKRYISFDMEKKRMYIVPVGSDSDTEGYPIGKLLLDFVNLDLTDYQREWEHVRHLLDDPDAYLEYSYFNRGLAYIDNKGNDAEFAKELCLDRGLSQNRGSLFYMKKAEKRYAKSCADLAALLELRCETKLQNAVRLYRI